MRHPVFFTSLKTVITVCQCQQNS